MAKENENGVQIPQDNGGGNAAAPKKNWREILGSRNKDLNLDDDDAVGEYLSGEFGRLDKNDETNRKMNELITGDKRNGGLLAGIFSGKGADGEDFRLMDYIVENWYDELKEATSPEDAIERINKKMAAEEEKAAKDAKKNEEIKANFETMSKALSEAQKQTGVDDATVQKMIDWLYGEKETEGLYLRIPSRTINTDDWTKLIHAFTRDKSLEDARKAGVREGRESRPANAHRSAEQRALAQTDLGGGSAGEEREDENPTATRYRGMGRRFA